MIIENGSEATSDRITFIETWGFFIFANGFPMSRVLILNTDMVTIYKATLHKGFLF